MLKIVAETDNYWVIDKPAGLLSQKDSGGEDSLIQEIQKITGAKFVGLVHRLDRNTSGLMLLAKDPRSAEIFTDALQRDQLIRRYEAILSGHIENDFSWTHFLEKNPSKNHVTVFRRPSPLSKEARLHGRCLKNFSIKGNPVSLVEFQLETGRSHQIRSQAAFEKHPIIGDHRYGKKLPPALMDFPRPALHSSFLSFKDPKSKAPISFDSQLKLNDFTTESIHVLRGQTS